MLRGFALILLVAPSALLADDLDTVRPLLAKYCQRCHGAEEQQAQVRFDRLAGFDSSTEQLWTSVHEVLIGGEMPPKGETQPTESRYEEGWFQCADEYVAMACPRLCYC
ncbi:MAG: c-type cytochrome domain-containing protein [Planctomycetota bacterium]